MSTTSTAQMSPAQRARLSFLRAECSAACGAAWLRLMEAADAVQALRTAGAEVVAVARAEGIRAERREALRAELQRWSALDAEEAAAFGRRAGVRIVKAA